MIDDLKPYPDVKPSGVAWLGDVPAHWGIRRLGNVARLIVSNVDKLVYENERSVRLCNYVDVYRNERIHNQLPLMRATATPAEVARFALRVDDVVITKDSEDWRDIGVPAYVAETATDVICGYHLAILRPSAGTDGQYLYWALRAEPSRLQFSVSAVGIMRYGLSQGDIRNVVLAVPPFDDQRTIARFLSAADRSITLYIRTKQKLIKLLEEQQQAVIHAVITRGLDTNARLKPSGVDYFNLVPEPWRVVRLRELLKPEVPLTYGILLPGPRLDHGIAYLGAGDVRLERMKLDTLPRTSPEIAAMYPRTKMKAGELVYAIRGSFGSVEVIPPELDGVNLSRDAARLAPRDGINPSWLAFALRSPPSQNQFQSKEIGATITGINIRDLKRVVLPVPPPGEQTEIGAFLEDALKGQAEAKQHLQREMRLLQEIRARLIFDVVTGKLDVREAATRLPVEVDAADAEVFDAADDFAGDEDETEEEAA